MPQTRTVDPRRAGESMAESFASVAPTIVGVLVVVLACAIVIVVALATRPSARTVVVGVGSLPHMTLSPGSLLGPYEVLAPLGAGGMGEVYRARDTRLDRDRKSVV